ncbi:MAG TPA: hypothetical protein VGW11_01385 [Solirubrobacteraceae bacterium]|nr:hypothetical protein [Solirubrobacteraceae bacterium]
MGLRDIYRVPPGPGLAGRMWIVMSVFVVAALALWLLLPASPFAVAATAIAVLLLVGGGVASVMASRQANEPPPRRPAPPPSE